MSVNELQTMAQKYFRHKSWRIVMNNCKCSRQSLSRRSCHGSNHELDLDESSCRLGLVSIGHSRLGFVAENPECPVRGKIETKEVTHMKSSENSAPEHVAAFDLIARGNLGSDSPL